MFRGAAQAIVKNGLFSLTTALAAEMVVRATRVRALSPTHDLSRTQDQKDKTIPSDAVRTTPPLR